MNMCGLDVMKNGHLNCHVAYLPMNVTLNAINGKVNLGEWQRIFIVELDYSRDRKVQFQIIGE